MSGSYYQDYLKKKAAKEQEQNEALVTTKNLTRQILKLKSDLKGLTDHVAVLTESVNASKDASVRDTVLQNRASLQEMKQTVLNLPLRLQARVDAVMKRVEKGEADCKELRSCREAAESRQEARLEEKVTDLKNQLSQLETRMTEQEQQPTNVKKKSPRGQCIADRSLEANEKLPVPPPFHKHYKATLRKKKPVPTVLPFQLSPGKRGSSRSCAREDLAFYYEKMQSLFQALQRALEQ